MKPIFIGIPILDIQDLSCYLQNIFNPAITQNLHHLQERIAPANGAGLGAIELTLMHVT
jgi:hypothetical protein